MRWAGQCRSSGHWEWGNRECESGRLCGGVFNVFGNVASIVTPLVIGYLVSELHSFNAALVFVGCSALMAMVCYLFVVGDIKRMELQK